MGHAHDMEIEAECKVELRDLLTRLSSSSGDLLIEGRASEMDVTG